MYNCVVFMFILLSYGDGSGGDAGGSQEQSSRQRSKRMLDRDSAQDTFLCDAPGRLLTCLSATREMFLKL